MSADNHPFPSGFDPAASLLFLGAGFSKAATNSLGQNPPTAYELEGKLKRICQLPDDEAGGLIDLATYAVELGVDLFAELNNWFTIKALTSDQKSILRQPWTRIYSTNYDDAVEVFWREERNAAHPATYSVNQPLPRKIPKGSVIHLHGYIHKCDQKSVLNELVLNHRSYAEQRAIKSPWWHQFEKDLRVCQHIFSVGYSLSDFEPASYLTQSPAYRAKTHFILRPEKSKVLIQRLSSYGSRHSFGLEGFALECQNAVKDQAPESHSSLKCLYYFDPNKDKKVASKPTAEDVEALYSLGTLNHQKLISTFPQLEYVLPRTGPLDEAVNALRENKTVIVHSKVGNGKSVFSETLALRLSTEGYTCFFAKETADLVPSELSYLSTIKDLVVFFRSYEQAYSWSVLLSDFPDDARFVVEVVTSTLQVRYGEIMNSLPSRISRVDVNKLRDTQLSDLTAILDRAGLAPRRLPEGIGPQPEFRDIVLSVFKHPGVRDRLTRRLRPILDDKRAMTILATTAITKAIGASVSPGFVHSMVGLDAYAELTKHGEGALEIIDFAHDRIEPYSSIFSEFFLTEYLDPVELSGAIFHIASEAAARMSEEADPNSERARESRAILGPAIRFGFLQRILRRSIDRDVIIKRIYERCRRDVNIQGEPLFWLQFSIFMQNTDRLDLAEKYMDTAYARAIHRTGFLTYQLDTNSLGLSLALETRSSNAAIDRFDRILELIGKVTAMLKEVNHRAHALLALSKVRVFVQSCQPKLSGIQKSSLALYLARVVDVLERFSLADRVEFGSDELKTNLLWCHAQLTSKP